MKILILEDEQPAFEKLLHFLQEYDSDLNYHWAQTVQQAKLFLNNETYDLILSDIQLLDGKAFEAFKNIEFQTPIIFCTAFNDFLLKAFKTNGIDYILKPYAKEDLFDSLNKFQKLFSNNEYSNATDLNKIEQFITQFSKPIDTFKKRYVIKKSNGIHLLNIEELVMVQANGDFCKMFDTQGNSHLVSKGIGKIEEELNPEQFFRINRSQIIAKNQILKIDSYSKNRLAIQLNQITEKLLTSTNVTSEFREWLEK